MVWVYIQRSGETYKVKWKFGREGRVVRGGEKSGNTRVRGCLPILSIITETIRNGICQSQTGIFRVRRNARASSFWLLTLKNWRAVDVHEIKHRLRAHARSLKHSPQLYTLDWLCICVGLLTRPAEAAYLILMVYSAQWRGRASKASYNVHTKIDRRL